ncbi:MAG: hypothetical protein ACO3QQ_06720 [Candidatus Nanopelagicaceae bacterium]
MIKLANTDLTVYPLCLGGNVFGYSADKQNSEAVLSFYADNGGNFIDTPICTPNGPQDTLAENQRRSLVIGWQSAAIVKK